MQAAIFSDRRTVKLGLTDAAVMDHEHGGRQFRPDHAQVEINLTTGGVAVVAVSGPTQTKTGQDHAGGARGNWSWHSHEWTGRPAVWPPDDAPACAVAAVDAALLAVSR